MPVNIHSRSKSFISELLVSFIDWRIVYLRSVQSIRSRYARSHLGQFWVTLSLSLLIVATGLIWSLIWGINPDVYLPYVACGHIFYLFLAGTIQESTTGIISEQRLFYKKKLSFFIAPQICLLRNLIIFVHNVPVIFFVILWSSTVSFGMSPYYPFYLLLIAANLFFASYFLSLLCVYYRDIIQLVNSVLNVAFLLTPVIWNTSQIPEAYRHFAYINPFTGALELLRNPILGETVSDMAIMSVTGWTAASVILTYILWKFRSTKAIYWI